jgi:hypothetical protein
MWFSYDFGTSTVAVKSLLWLGIPGDFQILAPVYSLFFYQDTEKLMKTGSTWYSPGSSRPDLPIGRKISGWLNQFPGKLTVHPGVDVTKLTISKFPRNPPTMQLCTPAAPSLWTTWKLLTLKYCVTPYRPYTFWTAEALSSRKSA